MMQVYPLGQKNFKDIREEKNFRFVVYSLFALVGLLSESQLEKQTARGRTDLVPTTKRYVYMMEFKLGDSARKAMEQINAGDYALPWSADGRKVFKTGVAFSAETRGISEFIIEEEK